MVECTEIVLTPIQNATELVTAQTAKVQAVCVRPPRLNPLQQTLQGSVVPMVNPGPLKICQLFLDPSTLQGFPLHEVSVLIGAMEDFIRVCDLAVKLNREVMEEKHAKFTLMIEKSFEEVRASIDQCTHNARAQLLVLQNAKEEPSTI